MPKETTSGSSNLKPQEVCIDLPGEAVQCWRSNDKVKVVLRKHRDVIFDINIKDNAIYSIESTSDFYSPREKKLLKKALFFDGERFHIWVGRNFKGNILLKSSDMVIGSYKIDELDNVKYGDDPKTKPEPLMVVIGKKQQEPLALKFTNDDPYGFGGSHSILRPMIDPKLEFLKGLGTDYHYKFSADQVDIKEYVAVAEAVPHEIQPQVLKKLDSGTAVEGQVEQIFIAPKSENDLSPLYLAIATAASNIAGNNVVNENYTKEGLGYVIEHFKRLGRLTMWVRIEKKAVGKYRVVFKGRPILLKFRPAPSIGLSASVMHKSFKLGSEESAFIDGGYKKTGRAGYGSVKRILLTSAENFRAGMKIQAFGTIIDLIGDTNTVYFDEKGSKDLTEFLGRAGVSLIKAGATAMLGSAIAVGVAAVVGAVSATIAVPTILVVGVIIGGYIIAATVIDKIDGTFNIKENVAAWAK